MDLFQFQTQTQTQILVPGRPDGTCNKGVNTARRGGGGGGELKAKRVNGHGRGILATFVHKPDLAMEKICLSEQTASWTQDWRFQF